MIFLLDHCVWKETETFLRKEGFTCLTLKELGRSDAANGEVIRIAKEKEAVLITRDSDFSNTFSYPPSRYKGIIVLSITPQTIQEVHEKLLDALRTHPPEELVGRLLTITPASYRLRS